MKMYVVTAGDYEGFLAYHIKGVFTDKEKAEAYAKWCGNDCRVEEYDNMDNFEYKKYYKVEFTCDIFDGEIIDMEIENRNNCQDDYVVVNKDYGHTIIMVRYVKEDDWNDDIKEKYIEQIKDIYKFVKYRVDLFSDSEITRMIKINDKGEIEYED